MTYVATVSSKGQFLIPRTIRASLGLKPGDRVSLTVEAGTIVLRPLRGSIVEETAGSLAKHVQRASAEGMRR